MPYNKYSKARNPGGRPGKWKLGKTTNIRVPVAIANELLQIAEELDKKGMDILEQNLNLSKSSG